MHSDGTELNTTMAFDRVCQNCDPSSCALTELTPINRVLRRSPLASIMFHSWSREVVACQYFAWYSLKYRIERCEENCLSSIFACFSQQRVPYLRIQEQSKELPLWNVNSFQLYGIATWPSNSGAINLPPVCPWMSRMYNKEFLNFGTHAALEPDLVAPTKIRISVELHADCFQLRAEHSLVLLPKNSLLLVELLSTSHHLKISEAFHQTSIHHLATAP